MGQAAREPTDPDGLDSSSWLVAAVRQLDDAILWLRFNEPEIGTWVLRAEGDPAGVAAEEILATGGDNWLVREIRLLWARTFRRLDLSARSLVAVIEPGSCFAGLGELALAADRSFMLDGPPAHEDLPVATLELTEANDGWYPMTNGLSRLRSRFWGKAADLDRAHGLVGKPLLAAEALAADPWQPRARRPGLGRRGPRHPRGVGQLLA